MTDGVEKLRDALRVVESHAGELEKEIERLQYIEATIRVNASRHGATPEQIIRLLDGRDDFIDWMASAIKEARNA